MFKKEIAYLQNKYPDAEVWESICDPEYIHIRTVIGQSQFFKEEPNKKPERFLLSIHSDEKFHVDTVRLEMLKQPKIIWINQRNLKAEDIRHAILEACEQAGAEYREIDVIPFTDHVEGLDLLNDYNTIYLFLGSTTLIKAVNRNTKFKNGVFYDPEVFTISNYIAKWGKKMLNHGARILTFKEISDLKEDPESLWFIRPDNDDKSFDGCIKKFSALLETYESAARYENTEVSLDTKIVVGKPYNIDKEWRLFIVDKKVVASSRYRKNFVLSKSGEDVPTEVIKFAEEACQIYTPHDIFVMDVGLSGGDFYIIECNCMNGSGFYEANINNIIGSVTKFISNKNKL